MTEVLQQSLSPVSQFASYKLWKSELISSSSPLDSGLWFCSLCYIQSTRKSIVPSAIGLWTSFIFRAQGVKIGSNTPSTLVLNTGAPQGCCPSQRLFSLFTHDCSATHGSNRITRFADATPIIGHLVRNEVAQLMRRCKDNNLALKVSKTNCIRQWSAQWCKMKRIDNSPQMH